MTTWYDCGRMSPDASRKVQSVQHTCRIIETLRVQGEAGVTELADELGLAKSAVHGHLTTLADEGFVVKRGRTYRLGLRYLDIAEHVKDQVPRYDVVKEQVEKLADWTGEVTSFGIEERGEVVYVTKARGESAVRTASRVGKRMPLHSTSLGKAILSRLPDERVDEILERRGLPERTPATVTTPEALRQELAATRERGYAVDDEENVPGVRCLGMAVSAPDGGVLGAVSVSGPSERMTDDRIDGELGEKLAQAVNVVEINSRYS